MCKLREVGTIETVWLIAKKDGKAEAFYMYEPNVEGYVNALRGRGYEKFTVAKTDYEIDNYGIVPQGGRELSHI